MINLVTNAVLVDGLIKSALGEDITSEDVSTNAIFKERAEGTVQLICKQDGVICGLKVFERVFKILDPNTQINFFAKDGDKAAKTQHIADVIGDMRVILQGERTALNFLQRMSGIATYTAEVAALLEESKTKLLDTRKTTPNMRLFEKYAVRCGGGNNHRYNLSDGVMLKDNHIGAAGGITQAVRAAKEYSSFVRKIEVEVESLEQCEEALAAGADIIMLDNMSVEDMKKAVKLIGGKALTECSGNVTRENIKNIISTGVDYVSSGALTHSAPILDLSLKNLKPAEER